MSGIPVFHTAAKSQAVKVQEQARTELASTDALLAELDALLGGEIVDISE